MLKNRWTKLVAAAAAGALLLAACGDDSDDEESGDEPVETTAPAPDADDSSDAGEDAAEEMDIVATAVAAGDFTTLAAALEAADLVETLQGDGPFTVFAPTDDAFAAALDDLGLTAEELLADTETLAGILTYHVVEGEVPAADVLELDGESVATVNGAEVTIGVDGETVTVNDVEVVQTDVEASNGVIHVLDGVLLPPEG